MPDLTLTHCPYCEDGEKGGSIFQWRVVELETKPSNIPGEKVRKIPAIEIYCARCERTLSITPVLTERAAEALSVL